MAQASHETRHAYKRAIEGGTVVREYRRQDEIDNLEVFWNYPAAANEDSRNDIGSHISGKSYVLIGTSGKHSDVESQMLSGSFPIGTIIDPGSALWMIAGSSWSSSIDEASEIDQIFRELGRMKDGWDGQDSVSPSEKVLNDFDLARRHFPSGARAPEVEVDPDDGSITCRWISNDMQSMLSLVFLGCGHVIVSLTSNIDHDRQAWKMALQNEVHLVEAFAKLEDYFVL